MTTIGGKVVDDALEHADAVLEAAGPFPYVAVRVDVLGLLVRWIDLVRPMRRAPEDPNRWQDAVDEQAASEASL